MALRRFVKMVRGGVKQSNGEVSEEEVNRVPRKDRKFGYFRKSKRNKKSSEGEKSKGRRFSKSRSRSRSINEKGGRSDATANTKSESEKHGESRTTAPTWRQVGSSRRDSPPDTPSDRISSDNNANGEVLKVEQLDQAISDPSAPIQATLSVDTLVHIETVLEQEKKASEYRKIPTKPVEQGGNANDSVSSESAYHIRLSPDVLTGLVSSGKKADLLPCDLAVGYIKFIPSNSNVTVAKGTPEELTSSPLVSNEAKSDEPKGRNCVRWRANSRLSSLYLTVVSENNARKTTDTGRMLFNDIKLEVGLKYDEKVIPMGSVSLSLPLEEEAMDCMRDLKVILPPEKLSKKRSGWAKLKKLNRNHAAHELDNDASLRVKIDVKASNNLENCPEFWDELPTGNLLDLDLKDDTVTATTVIGSGLEASVTTEPVLWSAFEATICCLGTGRASGVQVLAEEKTPLLETTGVVVSKKEMIPDSDSANNIMPTNEALAKSMLADVPSVDEANLNSKEAITTTTFDNSDAKNVLLFPDCCAEEYIHCQESSGSTMYISTFSEESTDPTEQKFTADPAVKDGSNEVKNEEDRSTLLPSSYEDSSSNFEETLHRKTETAPSLSSIRSINVDGNSLRDNSVDGDEPSLKSTRTDQRPCDEKYVSLMSACCGDEDVAIIRPCGDEDDNIIQPISTEEESKAKDFGQQTFSSEKNATIVPSVEVSHCQMEDNAVRSPENVEDVFSSRFEEIPKEATKQAAHRSFSFSMRKRSKQKSVRRSSNKSMGLMMARSPRREHSAEGTPISDKQSKVDSIASVRKPANTKEQSDRTPEMIQDFSDTTGKKTTITGVSPTRSPLPAFAAAEMVNTDQLQVKRTTSIQSVPTVLPSSRPLYAAPVSSRVRPTFEATLTKQPENVLAPKTAISKHSTSPIKRLLRPASKELSSSLEKITATSETTSPPSKHFTEQERVKKEHKEIVAPNRKTLDSTLKPKRQGKLSSMAPPQLIIPNVSQDVVSLNGSWSLWNGNRPATLPPEVVPVHAKAMPSPMPSTAKKNLKTKMPLPEKQFEEEMSLDTQSTKQRSPNPIKANIISPLSVYPPHQQSKTVKAIKDPVSGPRHRRARKATNRRKRKKKKAKAVEMFPLVDPEPSNSFTSAETSMHDFSHDGYPELGCFQCFNFENQCALRQATSTFSNASESFSEDDRSKLQVKRWRKKKSRTQHYEL